MPNLTQNVTFLRLMNAQAAGATAVNGTHVDTQGYDGVVFVLGVGALTATQVTSLKAQHGAASDDSDMADATGAASGAYADADGNKCMVLEVYRPQKRYVRPVVLRATANAVIDFVLGILYQGLRLPVGGPLSPALDSTIKAVTVVASP